MQKIELAKANAGANLRIESLPFEKVPGQSKLFLQYQSDPLLLKKFFPSAVADVKEIPDRIPKVLENYETDRASLCDALLDQNRSFGAGKPTLANIERLRANDTVAVVTGQQAGIFGGPLYTIYKALSAIRLAEDLSANGHNAVPVFWAATEDHDFEEIAATEVIGPDGELKRITTDIQPSPEGLSVGDVQLDHRIDNTVAALLDALPVTESSEDVKMLVTETYTSGSTFGIAFAKLMARTFSRYGLIVLDPLDERIKHLASPIFSLAIERSDEIVEALIARGRELTDAGYHAQVLVEDDYFPLFWHDDDGVRRSLKRNDGKLRVTGTREELDRSSLADAAVNEPRRLSPGVMLRPAVQDHLLPTICYFGGAAEIAYFGQNSEVYRILERPVTPILHRQSFTVVEAKHQRTLERFGLEFADMFAGIEKLLPGIVSEYLDPKTSKVIADVEERINADLNRLDREFTNVDPTLAVNLATRRRKIMYHIAALYKKFQATQLRKDETVNRQLASAFAALFPHGGLQERSINLFSFTDRYGENFVDWLYEGVDLNDEGHRVIYL